MYDVYLARASEFFGIGKVREIYEAAIEAQPPDALSDGDTRTVCLRYAALERQLGEIDRARAILVHASSLADPKMAPAFWLTWNDFEVKHGNEETFREMLRIKRSVAAAFSEQHFNTSVIDVAVVAAGPSGGGGGGGGGVMAAAAAGLKRKADDMAALEEELMGEGEAVNDGAMGTRVPGFVSAGIIQQTQPAVDAGGGGAVAVVNSEDIELGDDDDDDDGGGDDVQVETKAVPEGVFGSLGDAAVAMKRQKVAE